MATLFLFNPFLCVKSGQQISIKSEFCQKTNQTSIQKIKHGRHFKLGALHGNYIQKGTFFTLTQFAGVPLPCCKIN